MFHSPRECKHTMIYNVYFVDEVEKSNTWNFQIYLSISFFLLL